MAGLYQCIEPDQFDEILFTRATIPLAEDIGFLPGDETEKLTSWMGAVFDNLDALVGAGKSVTKQTQLPRRRT